MDPSLANAVTPVLGVLASVEHLRHGFPLIYAAIVGFLAGFLVSIPVGPVNLTIVNEGARTGFKYAALIGVGATVMEVIYCFIAFTGLGSFFENDYVKAAMELISFIFLLYLGIRFLKASTATMAVRFGKVTDKIGEQIERRLHPSSAFMIGFVQVLGNPGVLVFWVICAGSFISIHDWVPADWSGRMSCVTGVALGTGLWFLSLSVAAARGYGKFSEKTLVRMEHFSGICLIGLACFHGGRIVWQLAQHALHRT